MIFIAPLLSCLLSNGSISGRVWIDANADKIRQDEELGLPGVEILLFQGWKPVLKTTTDARGNYKFSHLPKGSYSIRAIPHFDKYLTSIPNGLWPSICVVTPGSRLIGIDFGMKAAKVSDDIDIIPLRARIDSPPPSGG